MRTLRRLVLRNYGCFRGEHVLVLDDKPYAIFAQLEGDHERSNYVGKTTLASAIPMLLHGWHPWDFDEDAITWGEKACEAEATFDDGAVASRAFERGRPYKLRFTPGGGATVAQEAAQAAIVEACGLSREDYFEVAHVEQKKVSKLLEKDTGDLLAILSAWFRLDRLNEAEEAAEVECAVLDGKRERLRDDLVRAKASVDDAVANAGGGMLQAEANVDQVKHYLDRAAKEVDEARSVVEQLSERARRWKDAERLREVVREGLALASVEADEVAPAQAAVDAALRAQAEAYATSKVRASEVATARAVAGGEFDGKCPVAKIACPALVQINGMRAEGRKMLEDAELDLELASEAVTKAGKLRDRALKELGEARSRLEKLERLRKERDELKDSARNAEPEPPNLDAERERLRDAIDKHSVASVAYDRAIEAQRRLALAEDGLKLSERTLAEHDADHGVARASKLVLEQAGRIVAEGQAGEIARDATRVLAEVGVDLSVTMQWEREADGLASTCGACGAPQPRSQKVKECPECAAPRGPKRVRQPRFVASRRSGGADDLAGLGLALAANAWLRRDRDAAWSVVVLDEAQAALDRHNRRALARAVAKMLVGFQIRQAFMITHDSASLDTLPGRIVVTGTHAGFSSAKVVA